MADPALADFYSRIEQYVELRHRVRAHLPRIQPERAANDPMTNAESRDSMAERLRRERSEAQHGGIFTKAIAVTVRERLDPQIRGAAAAETRSSIRDDAPTPFVLRINDSYPFAASFATMPGAVLAVLPALPPGLEYRIVGSHLILRDTEANLIVDYLLNVM